MMRWIIGTSLKFRFVVVAVALATVYFGAERMDDMPLDVFPEFSPPRVEIQTPSVGLSTREVEEFVTVPIEQVLQGIPNLDVMRSKSVPQLSSVFMIFDRGTDLLEARQAVSERLDRVVPSLPTWASPPVLMPPLSSTSRIMKIGLSSEKYSVIEMSMTAYWTIRQRLMRVPGVANVAIWGERLQMMQVQTEPDRLQALGLTVDDIMETTAQAIDVGLLRYVEGAVVGAAGFVETPNQRFSLHHVLPINSAEELANVPITKNGMSVRLGDVTQVIEGHQQMTGDAIIGDDIGLLLIVEKFPWANTFDVTLGVDEALEKLRPGLEGINIDSEIFRPASFIEMSIDNLTTALLLGAALVVVVLGAFLFEWRVALISVFAIPLSLLAAAFVLSFTGTTVNVMVLAGFVIALGAVVDDGIIDVENIVRRLRQNRLEGGTKSTARVILEATLEIRTAIVYATLIIILVVVPVFFLEGLSGAFFKPLVFSYALALAASMVVAVTVTPALSLIFLANAPLEKRQSPLTRWLQRHYDRFLSRIVNNPRPVYAIAGAFVLAGVGLWPLLGHELLPSFKERDFLMHWVTKPGTSWPEMDRITIAASKELREIEGVRNFGAHIGQALLMDEVVGVNFGENWISVDPSVDYDATVAKIHEVVDGYPGLYRDVLTYLKERIREVLTGTGEASIVIRIFGPEMDGLRATADRLRDRIAEIDGIVQPHVELQHDIPQIEIEVDLERAEAFGLTPGDVRRATSIFISGLEVGDIHTSSRTYDVQVWSTPESRDSLTDIEEFLIHAPDGGYVRLADVADVRISPETNVIVRESRSRRIDLEARSEGRDLGSVVADVEAIVQEFDFPLGYYPQVIGEFAELEAARNRLLSIELLAMTGIFLLLQMTFQSWRLTTLAFLALPAAVVGGVFAALMGGGILTLGSLVGFLTVLGIAARNGILLISHCQHLERHEGMNFGPELVLRGARERLAPILMTAITTAAALIPLVIAGTLPGHEIEHPMAVVILGGLVTSTLLNLFVVPSLLLRFGKGTAGTASSGSAASPVPS